MKTFLWGVIREALLSGSTEAIRDAAELLAKRLPFSAERLQAFLTACLEAVIRLGDDWVNTLASAMLAPVLASDPVGCDAENCPHEIREYAPIVAEFRLAA